MLSQLHFLQPLWLLALIPLALLWWLTAQPQSGSSKTWAKVIDANLLPLLLSGSNEKQNTTQSLGKCLLAIGWLITTIALADPVWEKIPRPVFQTNAARIIVLDLSSSMLIADLKPSRLARARFKIEDILSANFTKKEEGQIGLVLFAGDAFTASPLTRDSETIRSLLQVLTPRIMPSQGSRVDLGVQKAHELLKQAGVENGQVLLIADGVSDQSATLDIIKKLRKNGHKLSVLAVGTEKGGALPDIKYRSGESITVKLESKNLQEIAQAGGGNYHLISTNNSDLESVLSTIGNAAAKPQEKDEDVNSEDWKSTGPLILLFLLPLAALAFRRGWLFNMIIVAGVLSVIQPQPAIASPLSDSLNRTWNNLWINKEQQADRALQTQQYDKANALSKNPMMQGSAKYKQKAYKEALKSFKQVKGADARYNEANTLAKMEKYKEAIKAYDNALALQPEMEDAIKNKAAIEELLKKQKDQKDNNDGESKDNKNKEEGKNKNNKDGKKGKDKDGKAEKNNEKSENQFSDANKKLDENRNEDTDKNSQENKDSEKQDNLKSKDEKDKQAKDKELQKEKGEGKPLDDKQDAKENTAQKGTKAAAEELTKEEKMAAEQWLRRIADDPGGLLRRKFQRQYQQRRRSTNDTEQPW